jgi:hypothetical protein
MSDCILKAEELSIIFVPNFINCFEYCFDVSDPAENRAKSGCFKRASSIDII